MWKKQMNNWTLSCIVVYNMFVPKSTPLSAIFHIHKRDRIVVPGNFLVGRCRELDRKALIFFDCLLLFPLIFNNRTTTFPSTLPIIHSRYRHMASNNEKRKPSGSKSPGTSKKPKDDGNNNNNNNKEEEKDSGPQKRLCALPEIHLPTFGLDVDPHRASLIMKSKLKWANGSTLKYCFVSPVGTQAQQDVVRNSWQTWKKYAQGLTFVEVDSAFDADIRIGFKM